MVFGAHAVGDNVGEHLRWYDARLRGIAERHRRRTAGSPVRHGRERVARRARVAARADPVDGRVPGPDGGLSSPAPPRRRGAARPSPTTRTTPCRRGARSTSRPTWAAPRPARGGGTAGRPGVRLRGPRGTTSRSPVRSRSSCGRRPTRPTPTGPPPSSTSSPTAGRSSCARGSAASATRATRWRPRARPPNTPTPIRIDLWDTSNAFLAGHRIRLEISSSNFPRFDRNLNTGGRWLGDRRRVAHQTVFHDAARPSRLILPVIPGMSRGATASRARAAAAWRPSNVRTWCRRASVGRGKMVKSRFSRPSHMRSRPHARPPRRRGDRA